MHARHATAATAIAIGLFTIVATSRAEDTIDPTDPVDSTHSSENATPMPPRHEDTATPTTPSSSGLQPHIVTDLRFGALFRNNSDYFSEASTFGYPIPSAGIGVVGDVGVEIVPRFTLAVAGNYYSEAAKRRYAKLALSSDALLVQARFAVLRTGDESVPFAAAMELVVGGGKYWIREGYSDPSLFAGTITHDDSSLGFSIGTDFWATVGPVRFVLGYAYHWAPAGITNDIGAEVRAGGHEITFGMGARF